MRQRLSSRQRVFCGVIAICTGMLYLGFCVHVVGSAWQRKEGDLALVSVLIQDASLLVVQFPFGFLPGFSSVMLSAVLNGLLWSILAGALYVWFIRKRVA